jgi:hypothetical protein
VADWEMLAGIVAAAGALLPEDGIPLRVTG